jgi:hypothetical protein
MECPKCGVKIRLESVAHVKWKNIWGGKIKCQECSSWLQLSKRSSVLSNLSIILVAIGIPFLTYYFPLSPYSIAACGVMYIAMLFIGKTRRWILSDDPQNTKQTHQI